MARVTGHVLERSQAVFKAFLKLVKNGTLIFHNNGYESSE